MTMPTMVTDVGVSAGPGEADRYPAASKARIGSALVAALLMFAVRRPRQARQAAQPGPVAGTGGDAAGRAV
jgi:hypothetical protein